MSYGHAGHSNHKNQICFVPDDSHRRIQKLSDIRSDVTEPLSRLPANCIERQGQIQKWIIEGGQEMCLTR